MKGMLPVELAVLSELQLPLDVSLIFTRCIVSTVTLRALESYQLNRLALCLCHAAFPFPY